MTWDWMKSPQQEIAMIYYLMTDAEKHMKQATPKDKPLYKHSFKTYKRALWDTLRAAKLSINSVRY